MAKKVVFNLQSVMDKKVPRQGGSPGLVVMDDDLCLICCKNCIVCLKTPKIHEKEARVGPFLKKCQGYGALH